MNRFHVWSYLAGVVVTACVIGLVRQAMAELGTNNSVSVTQSAQTITVGTAANPATDVLIVNDAASSHETYHRLFSCGETVSAATSTNGARLQPGDFRSYRRAQTESGTGYCAVSIVCASGETATARLEWK